MGPTKGDELYFRAESPTSWHSGEMEWKEMKLGEDSSKDMCAFEEVSTIGRQRNLD